MIEMGKKKKNNPGPAIVINMNWWQIGLVIVGIILACSFENPTDDTLRLLIKLTRLIKS
jgi:hypothetical protein